MLDENYNIKLADFGLSSVQPRNKTMKGTFRYIAPEIQEGKEYSGQNVDIFAAGIVLFIMVTKHSPFNSASLTDVHYRTICSNRLDLFWRHHSKNKPGELSFFSEELRDLITLMFAYNPVDRPSLAEIKAHPWYNGPMPSAEEIKNEFTERKAMLNEEDKRDDEDPEFKTDPNVFSKNVVHRGLRGELEDSIDLSTIKREEAEYVPEFNRYSQFFSTYKVEKLFDALALFCEKVTTEFEFQPD